MTESIKSAARCPITLIRWRSLAGARQFASDAFSTFQGRMMLLLLIVAAPGLAELIVAGVPLSGLEGASRLGALLVAHVTLAVCLAVMVPVMLVRNLVLRRSEEPLTAHPSFLPDLAAVQVGGVILWASAFLLAFFYLFYGHVVYSALDARREWLGIHFGVGALQFALLGLFMAIATRALVSGPSRLVSAERLQQLGVVPFLISFPLFGTLPSFVQQNHPEKLTRIGDLAGGFHFLLQLPLAIPSALDRGAFGSVIFLCSALMLGLYLLGRTVWSWRTRALQELSRATGHGAFIRRARIRVLPAVPLRVFGQLHLFWRKDFVARDWDSYPIRLQLHVVLLVVGVGLAAFALPESGSVELTPSFALRLGASELLITLLAYLSMVRCLRSLGEEGEPIALLRRLMSVRRLFVIKSLLNAGYLLLHTPLYGVAIWLSRALTGAQVQSLGSLLAEGAVAALTLSILASGIGFLFPDFRRRLAISPGASRVSQVLFAVASGLAITSYAVGFQLEKQGVLSHFDLTGFVAALIALTLAFSGTVAAYGIHRVQTMEI